MSLFKLWLLLIQRSPCWGVSMDISHFDYAAIVLECEPPRTDTLN